MPQLPRVTCLCLTFAGRQEFLKRALGSFKIQTYPNRRLLIVADGWDNVETLMDDHGLFPADIEGEVYIPLAQCNIGQKRNLGCQSANPSDLIAIWDDDDYSAPGRLLQQVDELQITGKAVTGYRGMKFTDAANWWQFQIDRGLVIGSSMMFRRSWWQQHPFPEIQVAEDTQFAAAASEAGQLTEVPDLNLMYATIHAGNTSKRDLAHPQYRPLPNFTWPAV